MLYADFNATTPIPKRVVDKMLPFLTEEFGNPSAVGNRLGAKARAAVDHARAQVGELIGSDPADIVFTSGGTESCAHALLGHLKAGHLKARSASTDAGASVATAGQAQPVLLHSSVEHSAVVEAGRFAADTGLASALEIPVSAEAGLSTDLLLELCRKHPRAVVSVMLANNETGEIFPILELAGQLKALGAVIHTDAVQAVGKLPINFASSGFDFLSLSAHKFGGPKGCGALILNSKAAWEPVVKGGGQESGRRGGTEAVPMIVAMGEAAALHREQLAEGLDERIAGLRNAFEEKLLNGIARTSINAKQMRRLVNTSSVCFDGVSGQELVAALAARDVIISAGSACASTGHKPSRVLTSMGLSALHCLSTVRISFGFETGQADIDLLFSTLVEEVARLRAQTAQELAARLGPR